MADLTANEKFFDGLIRHQIGLIRVGPSVTAKVLSLLAKTEDAVRGQIASRISAGLSTAKLSRVLASIEDIRDEGWSRAIETWDDQLLTIVKAEPLFVDGLLNSVSPAVLQTKLPSAEQLARIVEANPFQGRVMKDWAQSLRAADLQRIEDTIKIGMTQGQTGAQIATRVLGTEDLAGTDGILQITRNNAVAITRTAITALTNDARNDYYQENDDAFSMELFVAVLDSRTTILCASHDGETYELGEGPKPPLHWNCRSQRVAVIDPDFVAERPMRNFTQKQLLREYTEQEGLDTVTARDDLPRGTKVGFDTFAKGRMRELTGVAPASLHYPEWLGRQPSAFQDDILGKTRGELFRSGKATLDQFVAPTGRLYTLEQLAASEVFSVED